MTTDTSDPRHTPPPAAPAEQPARWTKDDAHVVREMVKHEGDLLNHRITWLVTLQGLLFAALGFAWKDAAALIYVLCSLGIATSLSTLYALSLGMKATGAMRDEWDKHKPPDYSGPDIIGIRTTSKYLRYLRPWYFLPVSFILCWLAVAVIHFRRT